MRTGQASYTGPRHPRKAPSVNVKIDLERLLSACADDAFDDGIRIDTELQPLSGPGGLVKPAVYEGGNYQLDRRWACAVPLTHQAAFRSYSWVSPPSTGRLTIGPDAALGGPVLGSGASRSSAWCGRASL